MYNKKQHSERSIELRSEKVRNIVGQIPPLLIRQGVLIIGLTLLVLFIISSFVPYKKTIPVEITIYKTPQIEKITALNDGVLLLDSILQEAEANQVIGNLLFNDTILPIKSKTKGKIIWNLQNNDSVRKNTLLCVVIPLQNKAIYGECRVDSSQKAMLRKGQKILLSDSQGRTFNGEISEIYPILLNNKELKIRIKLDKIQTDEIYLNGQIILREDSLLEYFYRQK